MRQVPVLLPDGYTMIAIPAIQHGFLLIVRHCAGLIQWWLCWVALADAGIIQRLQVYGAMGIPIMLPTDDHPVTPGHPSVLWDLFQHTECNVSLKFSSSFIIPVGRHLGR